MTGEFVRAIGITNSATTLMASCDGIYHGDNTTLAALRAIRVETACVSIDVVLTNGYAPIVLGATGRACLNRLLDLMNGTNWSIHLRTAERHPPL